MVNKMMKKCCDTCNYFEGSNATCPFTSTERFPQKWEVLEDCCNRWEEKKENKLDILCTDITLKMSGEQYWNRKSIVVVDYFKQRIEESINKYEESRAKNGGFDNHFSLTIKKAFDWIL